jgi:hypothetical protein
MWTATSIATCAAVLLSAASCGSASSGAARSAPSFDPTNFVKNVDNPWYPLTPGTTLRYRGEKDGRPGVDLFTVTHRRKTILGVSTTVVHDRVFADGKLSEDTLDYYAQDKQGNVWYLGEDTKELDANGNVKSRDGTWRAGVHGAEPGIFMAARPRVGQTFRQEYLRGQAEDHFQVLSLKTAVTVPAVSTQRAMLTKEWTPLEPGVLDHKYYVRGKGTVLEKTVKGGSERWELESVSVR